MNNTLTLSPSHPLTLTPSPSPAPDNMAAAEMVYNDDNSVAWDRMWDSF